MFAGKHQIFIFTQKEMAELIIPKISTDKAIDIEEAEQLLENKAELEEINQINWKNFPYQPGVKFRIAHTGNEIWLKYYVHEKNILAKETRTNGNVYKDSCVEFFISFDGKNYYNFEFNGIGTIHLAYGPGRKDRKFVNPGMVSKIETRPSLGRLPFDEKSGEFDWELMIRIPMVSFAFNFIDTFEKVKAKGNFYKCGDDTSEPHFVTWNPVKTDQPDYHRPEYFGKIKFD